MSFKKLLAVGVMVLGVAGMWTASSVTQVQADDRPVIFPRQGAVKGNVVDKSGLIVTTKSLVQLINDFGVVQSEQVIYGGTFYFEHVPTGTYTIHVETNDDRFGDSPVTVASRVNYQDVEVHDVR